MMTYRIKQKLFSLTDSFTIEDANGNTAYQVQGKLFSLSSSQTFTDAKGTELLKIKRKYLSLMPACRLLNRNGSEWLVKKKFWPFWTSRFIISTAQGELEISGDFWQHEYQICRQGEVLASISKKWFSWSDSYGVEVLAPELTAQLLACVIVIDRIQHSDKNSGIGGD